MHSVVSELHYNKLVKGTKDDWNERLVSVAKAQAAGRSHHHRSASRKLVKGMPTVFL